MGTTKKKRQDNFERAMFLYGFKKAHVVDKNVSRENERFANNMGSIKNWSFTYYRGFVEGPLYSGANYADVMVAYKSTSRTRTFINLFLKAAISNEKNFVYRTVMKQLSPSVVSTLSSDYVEIKIFDVMGKVYNIGEFEVGNTLKFKRGKDFYRSKLNLNSIPRLKKLVHFSFGLFGVFCKSKIFKVNNNRIPGGSKYRLYRNFDDWFKKIDKRNTYHLVGKKPYPLEYYKDHWHVTTKTSDYSLKTILIDYYKSNYSPDEILNHDKDPKEILVKFNYLYRKDYYLK